MLCAFMSMPLRLSHTFLTAVYLWIKLLGQRVHISSVLVENSKLFFRMLYHSQQAVLWACPYCSWLPIESSEFSFFSNLTVDVDISCGLMLYFSHSSTFLYVCGFFRHPVCEMPSNPSIVHCDLSIKLFIYCENKPPLRGICVLLIFSFSVCLLSLILFHLV